MLDFMNFINNINFLVDYCSETVGIGKIVKLAVNIVNLIKWGVPILLIIFGMLDLGKAVIAGKEDEMKKSQGALIKRFIYAVAVFLVITLVTFVMKLVGDADADAGADSWSSCWAKYALIETKNGLLK